VKEQLRYARQNLASSSQRKKALNRRKKIADLRWAQVAGQHVSTPKTHKGRTDVHSGDPRKCPIQLPGSMGHFKTARPEWREKRGKGRKTTPLNPKRTARPPLLNPADPVGKLESLSLEKLPLVRKFVKAVKVKCRSAQDATKSTTGLGKNKTYHSHYSIKVLGGGRN